ncbi:peptide ligase PGM1-related protein [Streptomyces anulatus]|uniref:peptide ligase PGM1-related protein n=1 Tax=Streptomyces anulatus TaxID=1892 RepID=UPI0033EF243D
MALSTDILKASHSAGSSAWSTGTATAVAPISFDEADRRLTEAGLDFRPGNSEGVVLYADRPLDGRNWRYAALARTHTRLAELEVRLAAAFGSEGL